MTGNHAGLRRIALWALAAAFGLGVATAPTHAKDKNDKEQIPLAAAQVFIEINDTDGDAGLQIFLDGVGWKQMKVLDPRGKRIAEFKGKGGVAKQGITELALESAEPSFDEQPLDDFLDRFEEGIYRFVGKTVGGDPLIGSAELTHDLPDGALIVVPEEDEEVSPDGFTMVWDEVVTPAGIEIIGYEVVVEREDPLRVLSIHLPASATEVSIPGEFLDPETEYKTEVIVREVSGNKTITEVEFETGP